MIRSANSFIVKEMEDCSASILDAEGQLLAEEAGPPIQLNTVGICLKTILEHYFPPEQWRPGDVVQIGRASCRERVCQYVSISVVADSLKKKQLSKITSEIE